MGFIATSRLFFDEFTGSGGGGVKYLNQLQGDKVTCEIEGYFFWAIQNQKFIFNAANKTITIAYSPVNGLGQTKGFIAAGFTLDDTFDVTGSALNNSSFTITAITDGQITVAEVVVDETANSANVWGTTPITDMNFFYDLIANNSTKVDFVSATDKETVQKYSATGLDATVATPVPLTIATKSFGWVTDIVSNDVEGEGFVEGDGIVDYKQKFKITHVFYMTRMWTKELIQNFVNRVAPEEFVKGNHLKHICQIEGLYEECNPFIPHKGSIINEKGEAGWFNQSNCQTLPEYSIASIQYQNDVTSEFLTELDGSIVNLVTLSIYSRSGKFVAGASEFIVNHFLCPLNEAEYVNTSTTLLQNIRLDKKKILMDAAAVNGIEFGTDYQSLTDIQASFVDANYVIITFKVDYSSITKALLKAKSANDRYYAFVVSCQDEAITTTKNIDRVNVLADFQNADYDLRDDSLLTLIDYIHCFKFPNAGVFESNDVVGYEGDPSYIEIPFRIESAVVDQKSPTLKNIKIQIVSTKTDNDDFVLEEKIFDTSLFRKLDDKQIINIETSRGFILPDDNPFNRADIVRYEEGDSGTLVAYKLRYAFALRFESWLEVVQASLGDSYDIFKDIENVVQAWKRYSTGYGWALKIRMTAQVAGYDDFVTTYQAETNVSILEASDAPTAGNDFDLTIQYFNEAGDEVEGLMKEEKTRIKATFRGDTSVFPAGMTEFNGWMFACDEFGSIFDRRIACTDFDSEDDSPFSSVGLPNYNPPVPEIESANIRLSVFANRVILESWYTIPEDDNSTNIIIVPRLGYSVANILLKEDGSALLQENGDYILLNT